jgi:hypothetical protein
MTTNRTRQAAFKARMRVAGLRQVTVWVTEPQARQLKEWLAGGAQDKTPQSVTGNNDLSALAPPPASLTTDNDLVLTHIAHWPDFGLEGLLALMELQKLPISNQVADQLRSPDRIAEARIACQQTLRLEILRQSAKEGVAVETLLASLQDRYLKICRSGKWKALSARVSRA